jgi:hypothetical protein
MILLAGGSLIASFLPTYPLAESGETALLMAMFQTALIIFLFRSIGNPISNFLKNLSRSKKQRDFATSTTPGVYVVTLVSLKASVGPSSIAPLWDYVSEELIKQAEGVSLHREGNELTLLFFDSPIVKSFEKALNILKQISWLVSQENRRHINGKADKPIRFNAGLIKGEMDYRAQGFFSFPHQLNWTPTANNPCLIEEVQALARYSSPWKDSHLSTLLTNLELVEYYAELEGQTTTNPWSYAKPTATRGSDYYIQELWPYELEFLEKEVNNTFLAQELKRDTTENMTSEHSNLANKKGPFAREILEEEIQWFAHITGAAKILLFERSAEKAEAPNLGESALTNSPSQDPSVSEVVPPSASVLIIKRGRRN